MDQSQLQQNIANYYAKLPSDLQQSFSSMTWVEDLKKISSKYSLNKEQIETLATETTLVLLSIIHLENYVLTLKKDLKLDEETFNKLLDDLDINILKDIKDGLVNTFELNVEFLNNEENKVDGEIITNYQLPITNKEVTKETIINEKKTVEDDEVPLPPYGRTITNDELKITNETPKEIPEVEVSPIQFTPKSAFEEKLKGPTVSEHTVSDYSTPKKNTLPPISEDKKIPSQDPYRESF